MFRFVICFLLSLALAPALWAFELDPNDHEMLTRIERDSAQYFIRLSDKMSGLTHDSSRPGSPASVAATGFSLASVAISASHGWMDSRLAYDQLAKTLKTLLLKAQHKNGFFYHFLDARTGRRVWASEASSIDTALVIAGALLAGQYYPGTEIQQMADAIYRRVDWKWMMNRSALICMGWTPESGFLHYYWDSYSEHILLQALAIGAIDNPIPPESWNDWLRNIDEYNNRKIVFSHSGSLFTYQYPHAFIDFRNLNDRGINYFKNSTAATLCNREYSLSFRGKYQGYAENSWGLSASLGPGGYKAYGAKPGLAIHDGTLAPYAVIGSLIFLPDEALDTIRHFYHSYAENLYGVFGFKDAFNLDKNWWAQEYLGIDQGITVLMLENFLNDYAVWRRFMGLTAVKRWLKLCNFQRPPEVPAN